MIIVDYRWLVLEVVDNFLASIMITFDALQQSDAHLSQQVTNMDRLADELVLKCGASIDESITEASDVASVAGNSITMGPYSASADKLKECVLSIGVTAMEAFDDLAQTEKNSVLRSVSVLYLVALNGIMQFKAERNCYNQDFDSVPPHTPLAMIEVPTVDFVRLVKKHKPRILHSFNESFMKKITEEQQLLSQSVCREPRLKAALLKTSKSASFNKVWDAAGERFSSLRMFASGIATVMPTTSRVEADFSFINYRKDEFNAALSDFSLEGVLFSRQRKDLEAYLTCLHE